MQFIVSSAAAPLSSYEQTVTNPSLEIKHPALISQKMNFLLCLRICPALE